MVYRNAEKEEKQRKKEELQLLEGLSNQGGFINEFLEEKAEEAFSELVMNTVYKYSNMGAGFCRLAEVAEQAVTELKIDDEYLMDIDDYMDLQSPIITWYIDQCVRIANEQLKSDIGRFWVSWNLTRATKKKLEKLTTLEERILFLTQGFDGEKKWTLSEIAESEEFQCEEEFIEFVFERLEEKQIFNGYNDEDLYKEFQFHLQGEEKIY